MSSYHYIYNSQLDAFSLYHLTHEANTRHSTIGPALPALGHATSGALGTAISKLITYPLDLVVTRLQVQKQLQGPNERSKYDGILDAIEKIYEREGGLAAFYNGVPHEVFKGVTDSFLFFLAYSYVRQSRLAAKSGQKSLPALEEIGVGVVAGAFSKFCTTPIQNIITRKQTAAMTALDSNTANPPASSTRDIAYNIKQEKGLQGFWSGYSASLILTLNPSVTMLLHKILLRLLVPRATRDDPGARITFLIAATSKALASTITYPFSLAKTRAQVSSQKPTEPVGETSELEKPSKPFETKAIRARQRTVFSTIMRIAQTEGFWGLYQGLGGEVLKGFFSHGITMLMKERIHAVIINLYYLTLKSLEKYPSPEELTKMASEEVQDAFEHGKERVSDAYAKGVEVAGQTAEKVREVVAEGSQQAQDLVASGKEQASEAYNKAAEATQSASSTAQGAISNGSQQAQGWVEAGKQQASGAYTKAAEAAQSVSSSAQDAANSGSERASEAYTKAQVVAGVGSNEVGHMVEKGKDVANNVSDQAKEAVMNTEIRDANGFGDSGTKE